MNRTPSRDNQPAVLAHTIENGTIEQLEHHLQTGNTVSTPQGKDGWPPLCCAVSRSRLDVVTALLKHGADPNERIRQGSGAGMVALDFCQDVAIAEILLNAGARLDIVDNHACTPLQWAESMNRREVAAFLAKAQEA